MGDSLFTTGFWSRFTFARHLSPAAVRDPETFRQDLLRTLARMTAPRVILPMEDATLRVISQHRESLARQAHFLIPPSEALEIAFDKGRTLSHAKTLGITVPATGEPDCPTSFAGMTMTRLSGEFVVKPRSVSGSRGLRYGESLSRDQWIEVWEREHGLLVQERIPAIGAGYGVSVLMDSDSRCLASFVHQRLQQYPIAGGPSTDRVSIVEAFLEEQSIKLLKSLHWKGVAMVEWKHDPRTGEFKLMEINPRFWGSLELAVRAGVDFPKLYVDACMGKAISPRPARAGTRVRWMIPGEILRYISTPRSQREGLHQFLKGALSLSEEWDPQDWKGFMATWICTLLLAFSPRYWSYLRKRRGV